MTALRITVSFRIRTKKKSPTIPCIHLRNLRSRWLSMKSTPLHRPGADCGAQHQSLYRHLLRQRLFRARSGKCRNFCVLYRWKHDVSSRVYPERFRQRIQADRDQPFRGFHDSFVQRQCNLKWNGQFKRHLYKDGELPKLTAPFKIQNLKKKSAFFCCGERIIYYIIRHTCLPDRDF